MELPEKPKFEPLKPQDVLGRFEAEYRTVPAPRHRHAPLEKDWISHFYDPIRNDMKIDIRMNFKAGIIQLKTMPHTPDINNLEKCRFYVHAFMLGFDPDQIKDAVFKYDHFYLDSFDIYDVKRSLKGEHLARTIGRICGKNGKTKFTIENATQTRIVVAGHMVHILGSHSAIKISRDCICRLIMGSPAAKIYARLRAIAARASERF